MSRSSWWVYAVIGLVAVVGGGISVIQTSVADFAGVGGAVVALGIVSLAFAVHVRPAVDSAQ